MEEANRAGKEQLMKLINKGRKSGELSYKEIMDSLQSVDLSAEQIDEVYEALSQMGIDIVSETGSSQGVDDVICDRRRGRRRADSDRALANDWDR